MEGKKCKRIWNIKNRERNEVEDSEKKNIREFLLQVYYWLISIKLKWGGSTHGCRLTAVNTLKTNKFGNTHNPRLKRVSKLPNKRQGSATFRISLKESY